MAASCCSSPSSPPHPIDEDSTEDSLFGGLGAAQFYAKHGVEHEEEWMRNARGMRIFTQRWIPAAGAGDDGGDGSSKSRRRGRVRGVLLALHGYTGDSSWTVQLTCVGMAARCRMAVFALDHQGHGRSEGLRASIPDIDPVLDDCVQFYNSMVKPRFPDSPIFLYGESLGGAVALLLHLRQREGGEAMAAMAMPALSGIVLCGAMCGVSAKFQPPWPLPSLLRLVARVLPDAPIVPTKPIPNLSFREPWKLRLALRNPLRVFLRPRPATALEILRIASHIESCLHEVSVPFLVVHGGDDVICDPQGVVSLYEKAKSSDKTLKLYDGMWHQLVGEPKENLDIVFSDICSWLEARAPLPSLDAAET